MRVFLTGGTGFVGGYLRAALRQAGHTLVALTRHPEPPADGITWLRGELAETDILTEAMRECDAVVHLVGILTEHGNATFQRVHVQGTEQVLAAMRQAGVTRLLHMSALGAGPKQPTAYFRSKWQAEELVRAAGIAYTIFRPALIFGPGDGFLSVLIRQVRRLPIVPVVGTGTYPFAPISIHAVCAAYLHALAHPQATLAKTVELCGPEVYSYEEILRLIAAHYAITKLRVHIPLWVMRLGIATAQALHLPTPITRDQLTMLLLGSVCDDQSPLPFSLPRITLAEGLGEYPAR